MAAMALALTSLPSLQTNCGCVPYQAVSALPTSGRTRTFCAASAAQACAKGDGGGAAVASSGAGAGVSDGAAPVVSETFCGFNVAWAAWAAGDICGLQIAASATVFS